VFNDFALMMLMMWPIIPMALIQLHLVPSFWRKIGLWTYLVVLLEWLPVAYIIRSLQDVLLQHEFYVPTPIIVIGVFLVVGGIVLHGWTAKLLGIKATVGYTELKPDDDVNNDNLVMSGPFSVVRHPSYGAHSLIFVGTFLMTGVIAVGITALIDFLIAYFVTMDLEEREPMERFGNQYNDYKRKVPKFFPKIGVHNNRDRD
jgi:protein-S-isoprenylcysteine O-methyltransferase Ste14